MGTEPHPPLSFEHSGNPRFQRNFDRARRNVRALGIVLVVLGALVIGGTVIAAVNVPKTDGGPSIFYWIMAIACLAGGGAQAVAGAMLGSLRAGPWYVAAVTAVGGMLYFPIGTVLYALVLFALWKARPVFFGGDHLPVEPDDEASNTELS